MKRFFVKIRLRLQLLLVTLFASLVACAANQNAQSALQGLPHTAKTGVHSLAKDVGVNVHIPDVTHSNGKRRQPAYVSVSTLSSTLIVNGVTPATITDLSPSSSSCTSAPSGGRDCTIQIEAPDGSDTFAINLYDGANGTGNVLSETMSTQTVTDDTTEIDFTLDAVVSQLVLTPSSVTIPAGSATNIPITVSALDADGNTIIAPPGNYVDSQGNSFQVALDYSDNVAPGNSSIITDAPNPQVATTQTLSYSGSPSLGGVIVANALGARPKISSNSVTIQITPTIIASATAPPSISPSYIAVGADHLLYFAGQFSSSNGSYAVLGRYSNQVKIFPIPSPTATAFSHASGAVLAGDGRVWTSLETGTAAIDVNGNVTAYPLVVPSAVPSAPSTPYNASFGQPVVAPSGLIEISDLLQPTLGFVPLTYAGSVGSVTSIAQSTNSDPTTLHYGVFDGQGALYASSNKSIFIYKNGLVTQITPSNTYNVMDMALSSNGSVYSVDGQPDIYQVSSSGAVPVPMSTAPGELLISIAPGIGSDLWVGGEESGKPLLARVGSNNSWQAFPFNNTCALTNIAVDSLSGTIYVYSYACRMFETIIY